MLKGSKIKPFLWFENQAGEVLHLDLQGLEARGDRPLSRRQPGPAGQVMTVAFRIEGQDFVALNGGPQFKFSEAISFVVECEDQDEIDYYWERLLADGGKPQQCGWLKDKFGVSWQVVPTRLERFFGDTRTRRARVMPALMKMVKLDIRQLEEAAR